MPYRYRYLPERHVLLESLFADVDLAQLVAMKTEQKEAGIGGLGLRALVDLRQSRFRFVSGQVRTFTQWMRQNLPGQLETRSAVLATGPVETGLSMLYATSIQPSKTVEVFDTLSAALDWLGVEEELLRGHHDVIPLDEDPVGH